MSQQSVQRAISPPRNTKAPITGTPCTVPSGREGSLAPQPVDTLAHILLAAVDEAALFIANAPTVTLPARDQRPQWSQSSKALPARAHS